MGAQTSSGGAHKVNSPPETSPPGISNARGPIPLKCQCELLSGRDPWHTNALEEYSVKSVRFSDGPCGVRGLGCTEQSSDCFACPVSMGATFDPDLIYQVGVALGEECISKGVTVLLGPMVNLIRHPLGGRNFEMFSEDPYLSGLMAVAYINGVQSQGVGCCIKHFVCNDTEIYRMSISVEISERPLREVYCLPFEMAIQHANPWAVMTAYNRIKGAHCNESPLVETILRKELQYDGLVVSDWGGTYSFNILKYDMLDLEMPKPHFAGSESLLLANKQGIISTSSIEKRVSRILEIVERRRELVEEKPQPLRHVGILRKAAAESIVLLKNTHNLLPLLPQKFTKGIAVIGEPGMYVHPWRSGGGSASVFPHYMVSPFQGIQSRLSDTVPLFYSVGCVFHNNTPPPPMEWFQSDTDEKSALDVDYYDSTGSCVAHTIIRQTHLHWSDTATLPAGLGFPFKCVIHGKFQPPHPGPYCFSIETSSTATLFLNDKPIVSSKPGPQRIIIHFGEPMPSINPEAESTGSPSPLVTSPGGTLDSSTAVSAAIPQTDWLPSKEWLNIRCEFESPNERHSSAFLHINCLPDYMNFSAERTTGLIQNAVKLAASVDCVVLVCGVGSGYEKEGEDRRDMCLPGSQNELIEAVCRANSNTVVVVLSGSPIECPWISLPDAVLHGWYLGQETGNAIAQVLFGEVNPCGKLPITIPRKLQHSPAYVGYPPGTDILYGEGIHVGYRYYEKCDLTQSCVLFPFGFGLSYTTFEWSNILVPEVAVGDINGSLVVTNTGRFPGKEIVQVYLHKRSSFKQSHPEEELVCIRAVFLAPGESLTVDFCVHQMSFRYYDDSWTCWSLDPGIMQLRISRSSADHVATVAVKWSPKKTRVD
ncbi:glycosyl hydrolase [Pelomyxa schiedti]|nr:glycosyl hydrolase [Pelomyxa schiedti]